MKTEEQTRSKIILDCEKVEEAKQLYLCHQVWHTFEPGEQWLHFFFVIYVNCKLAIIKLFSNKFYHISVVNIACVHIFIYSHHWFAHAESPPNIDCRMKIYLEIIISLFIFFFLPLMKSPGNSLNQTDNQFGDLLLISTMSYRRSTLSVAWTS